MTKGDAERRAEKLETHPEGSRRNRREEGLGASRVTARREHSGPETEQLSEAVVERENMWSVLEQVERNSGAPFSAIVSGSALNGSNGDNRFTQLPRNSFRLPRIRNLDVRVSKRFKFGESYALEILADGFNVFNSTHVFQESNALYTAAANCAVTNGIVTNDANGLCFTPAFGSVTTTDSNKYRERQIQFGVRFQF